MQAWLTPGLPFVHPEWTGNEKEASRYPHPGRTFWQCKSCSVTSPSPAPIRHVTAVWVVQPSPAQPLFLFPNPFSPLASPFQRKRRSSELFFFFCLFSRHTCRAVCLFYLPSVRSGPTHNTTRHDTTSLPRKTRQDKTDTRALSAFITVAWHGPHETKMAAPQYNPNLSNGTCYYVENTKTKGNFIPCGNAAIQAWPCCMAGSFCLSLGDANACWDAKC